jgi:hypothetical protein
MLSKINISELVFDFLLILLSVINFYSIDTGIDSALANSGFVVTIYSLIFLLVPMLLGVYMARLKQAYDGTLMAFIMVSIWIYYLIIAMSLMRSSAIHLSQYSTEEEAGSEVFGAIFILVFMVIGPICGNLLKNRETSILNGEKPNGTTLAAIVIVILVTVSVMFFFINLEYIISIVPFESAALNIILGVILLIGIITVAIILSSRWGPFLKREKVKNNLQLARSLLLPLLTSVIFFFLLKMEYGILDVMDNVSDCDFGCKIFVMLVTGIIPFRIIMLIAPPFKWINLITGIIAMIVIIILQY